MSRCVISSDAEDDKLDWNDERFKASSLCRTLLNSHRHGECLIEYLKTPRPVVRLYADSRRIDV